jgi:hypothetical protein
LGDCIQGYFAFIVNGVETNAAELILIAVAKSKNLIDPCIRF